MLTPNRLKNNLVLHNVTGSTLKCIWAITWPTCLRTS